MKQTNKSGSDVIPYPNSQKNKSNNHNNLLGLNDLGYESDELAVTTSEDLIILKNAIINHLKSSKIKKRNPSFYLLLKRINNEVLKRNFKITKNDSISYTFDIETEIIDNNSHNIRNNYISDKNLNNNFFCYKNSLINNNPNFPHQAFDNENYIGSDTILSSEELSDAEALEPHLLLKRNNIININDNNKIEHDACIIDKNALNPLIINSESSNKNKNFKNLNKLIYVNSQGYKAYNSWLLEKQSVLNLSWNSLNIYKNNFNQKYNKTIKLNNNNNNSNSTLDNNNFESEPRHFSQNLTTIYSMNFSCESYYKKKKLQGKITKEKDNCYKIKTNKEDLQLYESLLKLKQNFKKKDENFLLSNKRSSHSLINEFKFPNFLQDRLLKISSKTKGFSADDFNLSENHLLIAPKENKYYIDSTAPKETSISSKFCFFHIIFSLINNSNTYN